MKCHFSFVLMFVSVIAAQDLRLPNEAGSVKFAVIGDPGTGDDQQYEVAEQMARYHQVFPFEFVIMAGDNLYGRERPRDYKRKFELPYKPLLDAGVKFYAALGNHDNATQRFYEKFNMGGQRYYTFRPAACVQFFALDSTYLGPDQVEWLKRSLKESDAQLKIAFFHHPLYSSGRRHGPDLELRRVLEPLFVEHGVDVVFTGHEHFYERLEPQQGIYHFIVGAAGKLRRGNIRKTDLTAAGFDEDYSFLLVELDDGRLSFQAISREGNTVDAGELPLLNKGEMISCAEGLEESGSAAKVVAK